MGVTDTMAVAGNTAPALRIVRRGSDYYSTHSENRPLRILAPDVDIAETQLLSTGSVWIPSSMRAALAEKVGKILPANLGT